MPNLVSSAFIIHEICVFIRTDLPQSIRQVTLRPYPLEESVTPASKGYKSPMR